MSGVTMKLEFSPDPLTDTTPSWVDVTRYVLESSWQVGKARDLDDVQAGSASFRLRNDDRRFEPEYAGGAYYPNIVPLRQFRLTLRADGVDYPHGRWFATSWDVSYPAGTAYGEVTVTCTDALGLLSLYVLGPLDPPDAAGLADVIGYDQPFAYYRMNDPDGSALVARKQRRHHHGHHQHPHGHRRTVYSHTSSPLGSDGFGPDGVYKLGTGSVSVVYGEPGLAVGDPDQSIQIVDQGTNQSPYARIPLADSGLFGDTNAFTVEFLHAANSQSMVNQRVFVLGPWTGSLHTFYVQAAPGNEYTASINLAGGGGIDLGSGVNCNVAGVTHHVAMTWDGLTLCIYVDGVLSASKSTAGGKALLVSGSPDYLYIGASNHSTHSCGGWIDEVAFWERALPASRIKAHADAALYRGYPQQVEGDRVGALLAAAGSYQWNPTANVDAGAFQILPVPHAGQAVFEELARTVHAAQPWALLWFAGDGNPHYLGWDYLAVGSRSTPVAVFGDAGGEIPYRDIVLTYDDEIYNQVSVSSDGGTTKTATDAASQSAYLQRAYADQGLALVNDADAASVATAIRDGWSQPQFRVDQITLRAVRDPRVYNQTLTRDLGDLIEVRRRGGSGAPVDVLTRILGRAHSYTRDGVFDTTWTLARGWNVADGDWRLGITGLSELNTTAALA